MLSAHWCLQGFRDSHTKFRPAVFPNLFWKASDKKFYRFALSRNNGIQRLFPVIIPRMIVDAPYQNRNIRRRKQRWTTQKQLCSNVWVCGTYPLSSLYTMRLFYDKLLEVYRTSKKLIEIMANIIILNPYCVKKTDFDGQSWTFSSNLTFRIL